MPKVHKDALHPPERPIVNGIKSVTARLGQYIDFFLKPIVSGTTACLRDTKQFIQLLEEIPCMSNSILITADVNSLCWLSNGLYKNQISPVDIGNFILQCLEFCLTNDYFWYNRNFYLQIMGVAMGAKFAPCVANLFMALWEEESIFQERPNQLKCYKCYIDDLIMIWEGDVNSLELFKSKLTQKISP